MIEIYAVLFVIIVSMLDALIKGNVMARYEWKDVPWFWKSNNYIYALVLFISCGAIANMYIMAVYSTKDAFLFTGYSLFMGVFGLESLLYWWWLKPLGIKQKAFWKPGDPVVGWFEYPEEAPWMDVIIIPKLISKFVGGKHYYFGHTTDYGIVTGSAFSFEIVVIVCVFKNIHF